MSRSRVIVFVGPVGSGKSTNIRLLSIYFRQMGIKTKETSLKTPFFITNVFSKFNHKVYSQYNFLINKITIILDLIINTFFILPVLSLFKIKLWEQLGYVVLVEEHLPGILVDYFHLTLLYRFNKRIVRWLIKVLYSCLSINKALIIFLVCDCDILPLRWRKRGSPKEHVSYLMSQQKIFAIFSNSLNNMLSLSTNRDIKDVFHDLTSIISHNITKHDSR